MPPVLHRGADIGGSDGVDVWGDNYWVHDVEVTNRDECVTVKVYTSAMHSHERSILTQIHF